MHDATPGDPPRPTSSSGAGRETELKLLLPDAAAIDRLLAQLGPELPALHQHNLYFDGPCAEWSRAGLAIRLREQNHEHVLTVKTVGEARGDFVERGEYERTIEPEVAWRFAHGGPMLEAAVSELLVDHGVALSEDLHATALIPVGSMDNLRRRAPLRVGNELSGTPADEWIVELDTTTYPDHSIVCEVEFEVDDVDGARAAVEALKEAFTRADVDWRPSSVSKRERLERILREHAG